MAIAPSYSTIVNDAFAFLGLAEFCSAKGARSQNSDERSSLPRMVDGTRSSHRDVVPAPPTGEIVGIDRGVRVLAALSDGTLFENIRPGSRRAAATKRHMRALDALTQKDSVGRVINRNSSTRISAIRRLSRAKEREANARRDWLHKVSRTIVDRFDGIAIENLNLHGMTRSAKGSIDEPGTNIRAKPGLNRSILDAGFGMLATLIGEKAEYAARQMVTVDASYTSQTCAECAHVAKSSREGAIFDCVSCGHTADADVNAARIILARAELRPTRAPG
jgi:putative transposase